MTATADLEISLRRRYGGLYDIDLRFSQPGSDADIRLVEETPAIELDVKALRQHHLNDQNYGEELSKQLFGDPKMLEAFNKARSSVQSKETALRVRLFIDPNAIELHSLRWETLRDPENPAAHLLTGENLTFSRYLSSFDWQPVRPRARGALKALLVIANPTDLDPAELAPVDVEGELARAKTSLGDIELSVLALIDDPVCFEGITFVGHPTLNQIQENLRQNYDILYLICHGALEGGEPLLWLENEDGKAHVVSGSDLTTHLQELRHRPRLVALASCQSAGSGDSKPKQSADGGALSALGPRLAEVGVPAVLAMQGNITMKTVETFMPRFFAALREEGQIDRAMAVARGAVRERSDYWMPVLFMRLKSGRLWYTPGFADNKEDLEKWPALLNHLQRKRVTPIIGSDLDESLLGSRREMARDWAESYNFPMAPHDRGDLPQVAQFLAVNQDQMFPRDEMLERLKAELIKRYGDQLSPNLREAELEEMLAEVGRLRRENNPADPYRVLAALDLPIYITTSPGNLLAEALRADGKDPIVEICRWNRDIEWLSSIYDNEPAYRPSSQRPLVYQLFGRLNEPASLVLTEDDYFDYLIGVTKNDDLIPPVIRRKLVDTSLLFLGFRLDDWNFRVIFRSIMNREGDRRRRRYSHVAAQINPEGGRILEPARARRYLENYFDAADISIYWGSAEDFIEKLKEKLENGH